MRQCASQFSTWLVVIIALHTLCVGQVATGHQPFNSYGGGPFDSVNLGNLNVHLAIPILHKAGRGMPFAYDLSYDSTIWTPVVSGSSKSWQPSANYGWLSPYGGTGGYLTNSSSTQLCLDGMGHPNGSITTVSAWTFHDQWGIVHHFNGEFIIYSDTSPDCTGTTMESFSSQATDGSGLVLNASSGGSTIVAPSGRVIIPSTTPPTGPVSTTVTDANGNQISQANVNGSGVFTDTLGQAALTVGGTNPVTFQYTPPGGTPVSYKINYSPFTVKTSFGCSGIAEFTATNVSLVSSITLPDNTSYSFVYEPTPGFSGDVTGRLKQITLPTGGSILYTYPGSNNGIVCADGSAAGLTRTLSPGGQWTYTRTNVSGNHWQTKITTPSDPQNAGTPPPGDDTLIDFQKDSATSNSTNGFYAVQSQSFQGSQTGGTLLGTTTTCYNANYSNCTTTAVSSPISEKDVYTTLPNNSTRLSRSTYNSFSLVLNQREFDYGVAMGVAPGTSHLVRETITAYASLTNGIVNRPSSIVVNDWTSGTASKIASSTFTYDQGTPTATSSTPQHIAVSGSRGNLTTLSMAKTTTASLARTFSYYDTGTPNVVTDINGAQTIYVYGTAVQGNSTVSCGNSFPTQINEPLGLARSLVWNCTGALSTQLTDENLNSGTSTYTDANFWRPANVTDQMSNQTNLTYIGQTAIEAALQNFNGGNSASDTRSTLDGFGRLILSQRLQAPAATNYDTTETDYNSLGLLQRTTMPFSATAGTTNSTAPGLARTYDALGRTLTVTDTNGGQASYIYSNNDVEQSISGTQVFHKQFEYDGLGRLTSVCEMTQETGSGTCGQSNQVNGFWTKYTYDALGHLLTVTQNAQAASASQQKRTFVYDMLGRMTSESNPEIGKNGVNGTITYTYDTISPCGDGNSYSSGGDLVQKKDNAGNTTCFSYDALHRALQEGNATISGATIRKFVYDSETSYPTGVSVSNGKMHMVEAQTLNSSNSVITDEFFSYSARGELTDVYESTLHSNGFYHTVAAYWPTGTLKTLSGIPGVPAINYGANGAGLDGEGRITKVTAASGTNPVSSVTYSTSSTTNFLGALTGVTFGSLDSDSFTYDPNSGRMLTYVFNVNGKADTGTLTWNTNGTLAQLAINDQIPTTADTQNCSYSYDDLQRVSGASCGTLWSQTFTYDAFGNITKSGSSSFTPGYVFSNNATTNQFFSIPGVSVSYDANGNLLTDNLNSYTWDANWGEPLSVTNGSITVNATYDALGRMVENSQSGTFTEFIYGPAGTKLAKANGQTLIKAFIALPAGTKAIYNPSGLAYYRHSDWLGSSRLASTQARGVYSSSAYGPFGEQYAKTGNADASFTGQDQDTVSTLYDFPARRYSPSQGRWISPDPLGRGSVTLTKPQTWNRYVYVSNNPLRLIDPMGMEETENCADDGCGGGGDDDSGGGGDDSGDTASGDDSGDDANGNNGGCAPDDAQCQQQESNQALQNALVDMLSNSNCAAVVGGPTLAGQAAAVGAIAGQLFGNPNPNIEFNSQPDEGISGIAQTVLTQGMTPPITIGVSQNFYDPSYAAQYAAQEGLSSLTFAQNQEVTIEHEYGHAMGDLNEVNNGSYGYGITTDIQGPDNPAVAPGLSDQNDHDVASNCINQPSDAEIETSEVDGILE